MLTRAGLSIAAALTLMAPPAAAQDWLVSPAPSVPLHAPVLPPPSPPVTQPPVAVELPPPDVTRRYPESVRRLLDPYGLSRRPTSTVTPHDPLLPSAPLLWPAMWSWSTPPDAAVIRWLTGARDQRFIAPPLIAFPNVPLTWLLGF